MRELDGALVLHIPPAGKAAAAGGKNERGCDQSIDVLVPDQFARTGRRVDPAPGTCLRSASDQHPPFRRSSLSRSSCGLQMRPIEIQGGSEPLLVLCGEFGQQLHLGNSRAIERLDVRPVDLDQISRWVPQIHLDAAIRKFVHRIAKRRRVERANRLRGIVGSMEIVHIYRKVLVERNLIFQLEDVQLQIAAAEIFVLKPKL